MGILRGLTFGRKCCPLREAEQNGATGLLHLSPGQDCAQLNRVPQKTSPGPLERGGSVSWDPSPGFLRGLPG